MKVVTERVKHAQIDSIVPHNLQHACDHALLSTQLDVLTLILPSNGKITATDLADL